ncbi:MAG: nicotinate-nucleotide--dimethylbenzimidazole phosphoribosyltransferase [Chloroflexi bacterium]|nr:nicotinate-nucleotide--dimethylbenzimidazole phosphoribosyltransferase [Chloroflexota bacterium]
MATSLDTILKEIKPLDSSAMAAAQSRQNSLTKPHGSLGRLEELSIQIAGIKGQVKPKLEHKTIITMVADHGVAAETVSLYPQEVTRQMVLNFLKGGAAINVLAGQIGARVIVVDMGVKGGFQPLPGLLCKMIDFGTKNMAQGPAMTRQQAIDAIEAGIQVAEAEMGKRVDIIGTGDMGIGNTTASSAIFAAISGRPVKKVTGRGTGIGDRQLAYKIKVIEKALSVNKPNPKDPIDVLAKVGGFEIGGLVGVILAGAAYRIPVVIDGFISGAAALIATSLSPQAKDYLIAAHLSAEAGHELLLQFLGLKPLLNLNMRLGEGTGAVMGIFLAEAAVGTLSQMATFAEAGVSEAKPLEPH